MRCKKHGGMIKGMIVMAVIVAVGYFFFMKKDDVRENSVKKTEANSVVTQNESAKSETTAPAAVATSAGSYETYDASKIAKAKTGKVALFFRASWCPSCKALDKDIREHMKDIPENVTILDVDYDKYTDLKKKYGVVMQHTLVQVDADGTEMQKWAGVPTLADLVNELSK